MALDLGHMEMKIVDNSQWGGYKKNGTMQLSMVIHTKFISSVMLLGVASFSSCRTSVPMPLSM